MTGYQGSAAHLQNAVKALKKAYSKRECPHCNVSMSTGCLARHTKACLHDDSNRRDCPQCGTRIFDLNKIRFCSRTCAAIYNNARRDRMIIPKTKTIICLACGKERERGRNALGLYCDNKCQSDHNWQRKKAQIKNGDISGMGKNSFRRFLIEEHGEQCVECGQGPIWNGKPLTLEMDHRDGDRSNNQISNLRLLCPHCHTQTPTWGKKKR